MQVVIQIRSKTGVHVVMRGSDNEFDAELMARQLMAVLDDDSPPPFREPFRNQWTGMGKRDKSIEVA